MAKKSDSKSKIDKLDWEQVKTTFNGLNYEEKLLWWTENVLEPLKHTKFPIRFEYTQSGAPLVPKFQQTENRETSYFTKGTECISIIPHTKKNDEIRSFWNWLCSKMTIPTVADWIEIYQKRMADLPSSNYSLYAQEIQRTIISEIEENKSNRWFNNGRSFALLDDPKRLKFGNLPLGAPTYSYEYLIENTIQGVQNAYKEMALENVINNSKNGPKHDKITWLGTPSQFAYLILELHDKGYIEYPTYRGEVSPKKLAERCFNNFEMKTTEGTLKTEFQTGSSLTETYRKKFTIPPIDETTDKRSGNKNKD